MIAVRKVSRSLVEAWIETFVGHAHFYDDIGYCWRMRVGVSGEFDAHRKSLNDELERHGYWMEFDRAGEAYVCRAVAGVELLRGFLLWKAELGAADRAEYDDRPREEKIAMFLNASTSETAMKTGTPNVH